MINEKDQKCQHKSWGHLVIQRLKKAKHVV
jgi:hypothetical protein